MNDLDLVLGDVLQVAVWLLTRSTMLEDAARLRYLRPGFAKDMCAFWKGHYTDDAFELAKMRAVGLKFVQMDGTPDRWRVSGYE